MQIAEATRDGLDTEDWGLNMEICDIINHTEDGPGDAAKAIKKRQDLNQFIQSVCQF